MVCAAVGTFEEGLQAITAHRPDLAIIDLSIPDGHGLDLAKDIHSQHPEIALLIFTMHDDGLYGERALRSGARGYVMKHEKPERILSAIRLLLKGEVVVSPQLAGQLLKSATAGKGSPVPSIERLSDRELEILQMIGSGLETKEIAVRLRRGIKTIETHRLRLKEKLSISSNSELIAKAASWVALASAKSIG
jgi:DNA-binding NarL/FixJ family response regulator